MVNIVIDEKEIKKFISIGKTVLSIFSFVLSLISFVIILVVTHDEMKRTDVIYLIYTFAFLISSLNISLQFLNRIKYIKIYQIIFSIILFCVLILTFFVIDFGIALYIENELNKIILILLNSFNILIVLVSVIFAII